MPYYKKMKHTGYLRHLLVRRSETTGEMLVHLVTTSQEECDLTELTQRLLALQLEGRIVGMGTHEELLKDNERYTGGCGSER